MRKHQRPTQPEMSISMFVMSGSLVLKSLKIFWNWGTIFNMMKTRMLTAKKTTKIG